MEISVKSGDMPEHRWALASTAVSGYFLELTITLKSAVLTVSVFKGVKFRHDPGYTECNLPTDSSSIGLEVLSGGQSIQTVPLGQHGGVTATFELDGEEEEVTVQIKKGAETIFEVQLKLQR